MSELESLRYIDHPTDDLARRLIAAFRPCEVPKPTPADRVAKLEALHAVIGTVTPRKNPDGSFTYTRAEWESIVNAYQRCGGPPGWKEFIAGLGPSSAAAPAPEAPKGEPPYVSGRCHFCLGEKTEAFRTTLSGDYPEGSWMCHDCERARLDGIAVGLGKGKATPKAPLRMWVCLECGWSTNRPCHGVRVAILFHLNPAQQTCRGSFVPLTPFVLKGRNLVQEGE